MSDESRPTAGDAGTTALLAALGRVADALERGVGAVARAAEAVERLTPPLPGPEAPLPGASAFVWHRDGDRLVPVDRVNRVPLVMLKGIDRQKATLLDNTRRFAAGLPANNALLWGARGMGKSSLVKAVHDVVAQDHPGLMLMEVHREDLASLPVLLGRLRGQHRRCILFCDDLSFDGQDSQYKSLKAVLEGGLEGRPGNVVFYATSNRRHLMPRDMVENETSTALNPSDSVEEKVSLSDRFGLWLGFHGCDQDTYLSMIDAYVAGYRLEVERDVLRREAVEWAVTRGARSGRVAWQFIQDLAGRLGQPLV